MGSISQVAQRMSADLPVPETRVLAVASHVRRRALLSPMSTTIQPQHLPTHHTYTQRKIEMCADMMRRLSLGEYRALLANGTTIQSVIPPG